MKIMHICKNFLPLHRNLVLKQEEMGMDPCVYFYTTRHMDIDPMYFPEGRVHSYNSSIRFLRTPLFFRKRINIASGNFLDFYRDKREYAILHAHMLFTDGEIACQAHKEFRVPYIVTVRKPDMDWWCWHIPLNRERGFEILRMASAVVFLSPAYKSALLKRLPQVLSADAEKKSFIIPNGIDDFWHRNALPVPGLKPEEEIRILTVGKINTGKNQLTVLKAVERLAAEGLKVRYTVVGEVMDKKVADKLKKSPLTDVLPACSKEALMEIYRSNHIFVLPSVTETFGLVYAEAMTQGLPVIYSRGQGFDEQFPEGDAGFAVDCTNPAAIGDAVLKILESYEEISSRCIQLSGKFRWDSVVAAQRLIYTALVGPVAP